MKVQFLQGSGLEANNGQFEFYSQKLNNGRYSYLSEDKQSVFIRDTKTKEVLNAKLEAIKFPFNTHPEMPTFFYIACLNGENWSKFCVYWMRKKGELEVLCANTDYTDKELGEIFSISNRQSNTIPKFHFNQNGGGYSKRDAVADKLRMWFGQDIEVRGLNLGWSPSLSL